ncbi:DNA polymerase Y family protein [Panacibacter ginsenosidivorans]|uniref:DNA polymerase Y family protein n=1 Tax=Panacibacter ginsenosidivorans TaxID=1813871 RepID=A0A5B8VDJ0_9BACT|nr:DNA polymerase Y family protein [Panacibacter ginsenosidivorans]QEC69339.1 DNA polymerase Y family protein [Panacibacter ginsenosidivorans]
MAHRFISIWFRSLRTDWFCRRQPALKVVAFALSVPDHRRKVITAVNTLAEKQGIHPGMVVADAKALYPNLQVLDDQPEMPARVLQALAEWCIRYSPVVAVDVPDGLILDASGCAHLWGGEEKYMDAIKSRLAAFGYQVQVAIADTIGAAWGFARYGNTSFLDLPAQALRLERATVEQLFHLGLHYIRDFCSMPRSALRRRFGELILKRLDQAFGTTKEILQPVVPVEPWQERLPCLEPIVTATGIAIAVQKLLDCLCKRLLEEGKGLRIAVLSAFRIDSKVVKIEIGTNRASHNTAHLFKLFEIKLSSIEPALGIELFVLEAKQVEDVEAPQATLWESSFGLENNAVAELLDRITGKMGMACVKRYLPDAHYWPERSFKPALSLEEKAATTWYMDRPRPLELLPKPEPIEVTAPIPDYPPMSFRYRGVFHKVIKADGPERIEQEWWLQEGQHRDYYVVEDEEGKRYWLFRSGHYDAAKTYGWYLHGFFA